MLFDPRSIIEALLTIWSLAQGALRFDRAMLLAAETRLGVQLAFALIFIAGLSEGFGSQSVVLFVNRLSRRNFILNLFASGILFVIGAMIWIGSIWLIATYVFQDRQSIMLVTRVVSLGFLPLLFGFLISTPYLGPGIGYMLQAWSFVIVLIAVQVVFDLPLLQSLVCTLGGWLLIQVLYRLLHRPVALVERWLWRTTTRQSEKLTPDQIPLVLSSYQAGVANAVEEDV